MKLEKRQVSPHTMDGFTTVEPIGRIGQMEKVIKLLQAIITSDQFIVTGSYALFQVGLSSSYSDLDISLLNPTEETKKVLKNLQEF